MEGSNATGGGAKRSYSAMSFFQSDQRNNATNGSKHAKVEVEPEPAAARSSVVPGLWVDKYRPALVDDLVGNADIVTKLGTWLRSWEAIHLHHQPGPRFNKENPGARAVLLSGPPGIGKTSTAHLVCRRLGFDVFELNASDTRSKSQLQSELKDTLGNSSMLGRPRAVIMDEVDGMSSGDRGGNAELIDLIKTARNPIICICNDRQSQSMRSLVNSCYDLQFKVPVLNQIRDRLQQILQKENRSLSASSLDKVITAANGDIRQCIHTLQFYSDTPCLTSSLDRTTKDNVLSVSNFEAARMILSDYNRVPFHQRYDSFFIDYDLIPLLIQENYLTRCPSIEDASAGADLLSTASVLEDNVHQNQNWELLNSVAYLNTGVPHFSRGSTGFSRFPMWLGKNSSMVKRNSDLRRLTQNCSSVLHCSEPSFRMDYVPFLRDHIFSPLQRTGKNGVDLVIDRMDEYHLTKSDACELLCEFVLLEKDPMEGLPSDVKSDWTRKYNKRYHGSQFTYDETQSTKTIVAKPKAAAPKSGGGSSARGSSRGGKAPARPRAPKRK